MEDTQTNLKPDIPNSFAYELVLCLADLSRKYERVFEEQARLRDQNVSEHERLTRDGREAIAKISSDTQFQDHVREIIKLIKAV